MRKRILSAVFSLGILLPTSGYSASLGADAVLLIGKAEISQQMRGLSGSLSVAKESLTISSDFPIDLKSLSARLSYKMDSFAAGERGQFGSQLTIAEADIQIGQLSIDSVLKVTNSGVTATVPIKARCTGLHVKNNLPVVFQLQGLVSESSDVTGGKRPQPQITSVGWERRSGVWAVTVDQCEAAPGFATFLQEEITRQWISSTVLAGEIQREINNEISTLVKTHLHLEKSLDEIETKVATDLVGFRDLGSVWVFPMNLKLSTLDESKTCAAVGTGQQITENLLEGAPENSELRFPEKIVQNWAQCLNQLGEFKRTDRGQDISGFRSLMNSRFMQFFAWPDLMRFAKSTDFHFFTDSYGKLSLQALNTEESGAVAYSVSAQVRTRMMYPAQGKWAPYMTFYTPVKVATLLSVADSRLTVSIASQPQTALQYRFDVPSSVLYSTAVPISSIESSVKSTLATESRQFELPEIELGSGLTYQATGLSRAGTYLKLRMEPRSVANTDANTDSESDEP